MIELKIVSRAPATRASATRCYRKALLAGVSAIPLACVTLTPHMATAAAITPATTCAPAISTAVSGPINLNGDCTITSTGVISGSPLGIVNTTISTLTTAGNISSGAGAAINNSGTITTLTNTNIISGASTGLANSGPIGAISNTGTISGGYNGIYNNGSSNSSAIAGTIGTLSNSGTISGGNFAVYNYGSIGTLTNSSIMSGASVAIYNAGSIAALSNSGTLVGTRNRAIFNSGTIGSLTNSLGGVITSSGSNTSVINNSGTIGVLSNAGTISGSGHAIYNNGTISSVTNSLGGVITSSGSNTSVIYNRGAIGVLSNAGTINGGRIAIYNLGSIDTLTNTGTINGGSGGVLNRGTITALSNTGTISGGSFGINNQGTKLAHVIPLSESLIRIQPSIAINTLSNSGVISGGSSAILNLGTIGSLVNSGTIISPVNAIFSTSGGNLGTISNSGLISGNINVQGQNLTITGGAGATFGALSGGTITLTAGDNLTFGAGNQALADNINLGTEGSVINSGILRISTANAPATISITGNYTQTSAGVLQIIVTPTISSQVNITGTANLAGELNYVFAPGTYTPKSYVFISASAGFNGTDFATKNYSSVPLSDVNTSYTLDPTGSLNILSGFTVSLVTNPTDNAIFSAQTQALAQSTQQTNASLLDVASTGGAAASPACGSQAVPNTNSASTNGVANSGQIAQAIASEFCAAGGWIEATGSLGHVGSAGGASAYNANGAGFLAGVDKLVGAGGLRVGLAVGYDETSLKDQSGGKANLDTTRLAVYSSLPINNFTLAAELGSGYAAGNTSRADGIGNIKANNNRLIINAGIQASTNVNLGRVTLSPQIGVRYVSVQATHFAESATGLGAAFALSGETQNYNSLQPYAQVTAHERFITASGFTVSPSVTVGIQDEAARRGGATSVFAADGTPFQTANNAIDPISALLGAGLSATKNNLTLFVNYTGQVSGNWNTQTGEAGLRINF